MGRIRWYRVGLVFERDQTPFTWTFHVRAFTADAARRLAAARAGTPHAVYVCQPSEPLRRVAQVEEIVAHYGPYPRSWNDPVVTPLRAALRVALESAREDGLDGEGDGANAPKPDPHEA